MRRALPPVVRPTMNSSWLFAPPSSTVRGNDRPTTRVAADSRPWYPAQPANDSFEPRYRELTELDSILAARLLRLEIALGVEAEGALNAARAIRSPLARAGESAKVSPGVRTFEAALAETLGGVYAWVFGELDALFRGEGVRAVPKRLLTDLGDHASVAGMRALLDDALAPLEPALLELARACIRFSLPR